MAENTYIIKGNDIVFGIPNGMTVPWGVLTSLKRKPSNTVAEFTDESGEIGTRVSYIVQLNGKYMIISSLDDSCAQGDAQKYTIELTYYPGIDLSPAEPSNLEN